MFRFLSDRYPLILQPLQEHQRFDNFYLDMNGIIHTCTHPDDAEIAIENLDEMFERIFAFTDALFRIVAPRLLMFLAVDGVAPRAKMNQQRSRRFRSAKDAERAMAEAIQRGDDIPSGMQFDSNVITPGTHFMHRLSARFRAWIDEKMKTDSAWQQGCTVVFSGSEVPGEGEHKIMDHIRAWRKSDRFSPNVRHCMYGLDADLMMLGLVAHAPHFTLIRERIRYGKGRQRKAPTITGTEQDADEFELLEISMLRDMLFLEFNRNDDVGNDDFSPRYRSRSPSRSPPRNRPPAPPPSTAVQKLTTPSGRTFKVEAARIVDDFVFMCMLVGNDFIPHLPHLDISEGAIELMFRVYRRLLPTWGGYLTDRNRLHPGRLESFLKVLSRREPGYFENRARSDGVPEYATERYRPAYYMQKLGLDIEAPGADDALRRLRRIYMEGLYWVLGYYHNGVTTWNWYYPEFYAILASDMVALRDVPVVFNPGRPFSPLTQLMAVLPPESAGCLPEPMRELMVRDESPVSDFYPREFTTDLNGKRNAWEAVVILPFIDEKRLLDAVSRIDMKALTSEEIERNQLGEEAWFHSKDYPTAEYETPPVRSSTFRPRSYNGGRGARSNYSQSRTPWSQTRRGSRGGARGSSRGGGATRGSASARGSTRGSALGGARGAARGDTRGSLRGNTSARGRPAQRDMPAKMGGEQSGARDAGGSGTPKTGGRFDSLTDMGDADELNNIDQ